MEIKWTRKTDRFSGRSYYTANSGKYTVNLDKHYMDQYRLRAYTRGDENARVEWTEYFDAKSQQAAKKHSQKILVMKFIEVYMKDEE